MRFNIYLSFAFAIAASNSVSAEESLTDILLE